MKRAQITTRIQPRGSYRGRDYSIITDDPEDVWAQWRRIGVTDGAKKALKCAELRRDGKHTDFTMVICNGEVCEARMTRWDIKTDLWVGDVRGVSDKAEDQ